MDIFFVLWAINQCYFVAHITLALAIGRSFSWLLYPSEIHSSFIFLALSYILAPQQTTGWSCIFPALVLVSISPRGPCSFLLEHGVRHHDLGARCVCSLLFKCSFFKVLLVDRAKKYMCIH